jgi:hypothetical protein
MAPKGSRGSRGVAAPLVITVRAKPRSATSVLERDAAGNWVARLVSPPVDGKANEELIGLVAQHFGCPKSAVSVRSGASARVKRVMVTGIRADRDGT